MEKMIEQYRKLKGKEREELRNELLKELFNAVTADDVLRYESGKLYVADKVLPEADILDIVSGAKSIRDMFVWQMLIRDMKYQANRMMYENSQSVDDMQFGKAVLYAVDVQENKLKNLSKIDVRQNKNTTDGKRS